MAKQLIVNPGASLPSRPGDVHLSDEQYLSLSLFASLKRKPSLDKFPGALVLRRYAKDDVIYRQGDDGWTAFYVVTTEDALALRQAELDAAPLVVRLGPERDHYTALEQEVASLRRRLEATRDPTQADEARRAGSIYVAVARSGAKQRPPSGRRRIVEGPIRNDLNQTLFIPRDASRSVDFDSLREPLFEGEAFGETSCLYRTPRSETVVATRDCYVLEMLRNILDQLQKDPTYKAKHDRNYRERTLQTHVRKLSLFAELTDEQFQKVLPALELVSFEPGQVIYDEHETGGDVYVIRTGLVRVMKNVTSLLRGSHVSSPRALAAVLLAGETQKGTPQAKLWQLLSEPSRAAVRTAAAAGGLIDAGAVVQAMNELIRSPQLTDAKEVKELLESPLHRERLRDLPAKRKEWSDLDVRRCNRFLLEALFPEQVGTAATAEGLPCILTHHSPGEFFGHTSVPSRSVRTTTCIADGHPNQYGMVELVRIAGEVFASLVELSPSLKQKVEAETQARKQQLRERLQAPIWDDSRQVELSEPFQALGLIQGQQLMLIDLDRCTRCDECVRACVNTHDDGRSRLFLDGPRFGRYLVPITCRSCLDPVCLMNCPVGSIHRGDDRQIVIENWCIGCGLCGSQCPYGSIQLHDVGVVPEAARGWRVAPASVVGNANWFAPRFRDHRWAALTGPIVFDREFKEVLIGSLGGKPPTEFVSSEQSYCFRLAFHLDRDPVRSGARFRLEAASVVKDLTMWVNGVEVKPDKEQRGKREYYLPAAPTAAKATTPAVFRKGHNVLAVRVTGKAALGENLLAVRLDEVRKPTIPQNIARELSEEVTEKMVTEKAVVCDLCSSLPQGPACVTACPHEAALRVNARFNFPSK